MAEKSGNRLHWRRHCPGDHLARAADLSLEEDGALLRLLDWAWTNGPIPVDAAGAAKLIRAPKSKAKMVGEVLARFFVLSDSGYTSPLLDEERREAEELVHKRREFGQAGGRKSQANRKQLVDQKVEQDSTGHSTAQHDTSEHDTSEHGSPPSDPSQEEIDLDSSRESSTRARRAALSALTLDKLSNQVLERLAELRPDLTAAEIRICVQKCADHHHERGIVREHWIPTLEDWVSRERPQRQTKPTEGGKVFQVNGREYVLRPNRGGERDAEHVALAREIGVTSIGKQRYELEALLRGRLEQMARGE